MKRYKESIESKLIRVTQVIKGMGIPFPKRGKLINRKQIIGYHGKLLALIKEKNITQWRYMTGREIFKSKTPQQKKKEE